MGVSSPEVMKATYGLSRALGERLVQSAFTLQVVGQEQMGLLFKGFSIPFLSTGEGIEVPEPNGLSHWQVSQRSGARQSPIQVMETVLGHYESFLKSLLGATNPGRFDAKIYSGNPAQYYRVWTIRDCFINTEDLEADMEGRQVLANVPGTLFYHYFGESKPGPLALAI